MSEEKQEQPVVADEATKEEKPVEEKKPEPANQPESSVEDLKKAKVLECEKEVARVLEQYGCKLEATTIIGTKNLQHLIKVVYNEKQQ